MGLHKLTGGGTPARLGLAVGLLAAAACALGTAGSPPPTLDVQRLTDGVHVLSGAPDGNVLVVTAGGTTLLVDGQAPARTPALRAALDGLGAGPVRWIVNTHYHEDHMGANAALAAEGATVVAHGNTRTYLTQSMHVEEFDWTLEPAPPEALPALTVTDSLTLHVGGEEVRILHAPRAHTGGDVIVHLRRANVIHTGDIVELSAFPFLDVWHDGTLDGMIDAVERMLALADEETRIVPGHGPVADRPTLAEYGEMLRTVRRRIDRALAEGTSGQELLASRPGEELDRRWGTAESGTRFVMLAYRGVVQER